MSRVSKNTNFSQLGPKSHKNWVRIGIRLKIKQIKVERAKTRLHVLAMRRDEPTHRFYTRVPCTRTFLQSQVVSLVWARWFSWTAGRCGSIRRVGTRSDEERGSGWWCCGRVSLKEWNRISPNCVQSVYGGYRRTENLSPADTWHVVAFSLLLIYMVPFTIYSFTRYSFTMYNC